MLTLRGSLEVADGCCTTGCGAAAGRTIESLGLRCGSGGYQSIVPAVASPIQISTASGVFVDLDVLGDFLAIEFLYALTTQALILRIGAEEASVTGVSGVFPTLFAGGETLTFTLDGAPVSVSFTAGAQTAAQVAAEINASCAMLGLPTPRATVATNGQITITGVLTGPLTGEITITGGSGAVQLGLSGLSDVGAGADVPVFGTFMCEFPRYPNAPARIQVSGVGGISLIAAGKTT